MMSNSTLPLGFLHSNIELVTCGQLFSYLDIAFPVELLFVRSFGGCDEIDKLYHLSTHLHLIVGVNDKLRQSVSIDKALTIIVEVHLKAVLGKAYQICIVCVLPSIAPCGVVVRNFRTTTSLSNSLSAKMFVRCSLIFDLLDW